jgi:hypothetical protein
MWLVSLSCPHHGMTSSGQHSKKALGILEDGRKIEEACVANGLLKRLLTADRGCIECVECGAEPVTLLEAERRGWVDFPAIPKKCVLKLKRNDRREEVLEAMDSASTLHEISLLSDNYVPKKDMPSKVGCLRWIREPCEEFRFACDTKEGDLLRGLRRRLLACDLYAEDLVSADLKNYPLVAWHLMQATDFPEEECLLGARRLMQGLGASSDSSWSFPPFQYFHPEIIESLQALYVEVTEEKRQLRERLDNKIANLYAEKERLAEMLKKRSDVDAFDRQAYLDWGESRKRSCCTFSFLSVQGCATCLRAFEEGHRLDMLKKNPPDWSALEDDISRLDEKVRWLLLSRR